MAKKRMDVDLTTKVQNVLKNAERYHQRFYELKKFTGPSLYFHRKARGLAGPLRTEERTDAIYAVLVSWGMHRMGGRGSKMRAYEEFSDSMQTIKSDLTKVKNRTTQIMQETDWNALARVFKRIRIMQTKTSIVGHSKVMAHLLPDLIAPIDRQYTFKFLFGNTHITNNIENEWFLLRKIHRDFFYPIVEDSSFQAQAARWMNDQDKYPWDTSILKIVDNLVIGAANKG